VFLSDYGFPFQDQGCRILQINEKGLLEGCLGGWHLEKFYSFVWGIFHNWKVQENDSFLAGPGMWWKYVNFNKKR